LTATEILSWSSLKWNDPHENWQFSTGPSNTIPNGTFAATKNGKTGTILLSKLYRRLL